MLLYSFSFLAFFTAVLVLFYKIPQKLKWTLLLLASYYFYASWKPAYLGIVILTTLVSYFAALLMQKRKSQKTLFLILALLINLGLLFIFKYFNFFSLTLDQAGILHLPQFKILIPIGISFYTLQVVGYLLDVYKGKVSPEKHLGYFALFTCFFPQLLAGPIERSTTLLPQLKKLPKFNYVDVADGAKLFGIGLFKKLVIADNLGVIVDRGFSSLPEYKGISLILLIFFYTWQIYMDFSGYTDMARGVARMIGINLLENFNLPYLASSVQDFWRRWHISFSTWLRDYIYFPLGGNRKGLVMTIVNTLIVFVISGLWHGAAWNFVIWGILHGTAISFERILKSIVGNKIILPKLVRILYAYILISIFWVFFRSPTINDALYILKNSLVGIKNIFSTEYIWSSISQLFLFNTVEIIITFGVLLLAIMMEILQRRSSLVQIIGRQPTLIRYAIYALIIFGVLQLRNAQIQEFIYTQF